eukprot:NODE_15_length_42055_cov_0.634117.p17 type:complete len:241 gc:universal NODE_15_length_42055_cov_0.634117:3300-4022(+)
MKNPYKTLGVGKDATSKEIRKAYYKLSLIHHPDKHDGNDAAFKEIVIAYKVLSEQKDAYDSGQLINEKDIWEKWNELDEMKKKYQNSKEEKKDILEAYTSSKGKIEEIFNKVIFLTLNDEDRVTQIVTDAVEKGDVKRYRKFFEEDAKSKNKRQKLMEDEAEEADIAKKDLLQHINTRYSVDHKDLKGKDLDELGVIMREKQKTGWYDMIANIEKRYTNCAEEDEVIDFSVKKKKKKSKK